MDQNDPNNILSKPDYTQAAKYFRMAMERSSQPEPYVVSSYIRAKAKAKAEADKKIESQRPARFRIWNPVFSKLRRMPRIPLIMTASPSRRFPRLWL